MDFLFKFYWVTVLVLQLLLDNTEASVGDNSAYYRNCREKCEKRKCQNNVLLFKKGMEETISDHVIELWRQKSFDVKTFEYLVQWNCRDECKYKCMHKTTDAFIARDWNIPQFHGKWPFVRLLGFQEPASVFFSALNFFIHYKGLMKFRQDVRPDSPFYIHWHAFAFICLNAWTWSFVFHSRDFPITELCDYVFAYSMVLASFWSMMIRVVHGKSKKMAGFITFLCTLFFLNHFVYLSFNTFDYTYNMKVNIFTGAVGGVGWMIWGLSQIKQKRYVWRLLVFVALALSTVALEIYDFPPIFWIFDSHALWHLSSAPITILFYKFITDDCVQLRKELIIDVEKMKLL